MESAAPQSTRDAAAELEALLLVAQTLVSSFDVDRNLRRAMRILHEQLGLSRGTVALVDPETREIRIAAAYGLTRQQLARGIYRPGEGVVGRVVASGQTMVVARISEEPMFLNRTASRPDKADISFVSVPIKLRGEVLGSLSADRVFDESVSLDEDVRVLEIIASIIAHAVRLYWTYRHEVAEGDRMRGELRRRYAMPNIIGESDSMQEVFRIVGKVASSQATILLRGESGTGKELIAHALHYQGLKPKGPFVAINCAALPENLLEAELFGYDKGAFTGAVASKPGRFELARGGTIFLDEVGDVPPALQAKLLRVLQERTFERLGRHQDADHRRADRLGDQPRSRGDVEERRVPRGPVLAPQRGADLSALRCAIAEKTCRCSSSSSSSGSRAPPGADVRLSAEAMRRLMSYPWPGNIRELENTMQRLVVLADDDEIGARDLPMHLLMHDAPDETATGGLTLDEEVEALERRRIIAALRTNAHVQAKAARSLGITARQLGYKMRKYDIEE